MLTTVNVFKVDFLVKTVCINESLKGLLVPRFYLLYQKIKKLHILFNFDVNKYTYCNGKQFLDKKC